jgi:hypothetical protein
MLAMRYLLLMVISCFALTALPVKQQSSQPKKWQANTENRQNPSQISRVLSAVEKEPTAKALKEPSKENAKDSPPATEKTFFEFTITDFVIALFTGVLAVVAWRQYLVYPRLERAYVFVEVKLKEPLVTTPSGNAGSPVSVCYRNHGKTPAVIIKLRAYPLIEERPPKALLKFPGSENEVSPGLVIGANEPYWGTVTCHISNTEMGEIDRLEKALFIVGRIEYKDVLGCRRKTGFCWQYRHHMQQASFIISPNTELNFYT